MTSQSHPSRRQILGWTGAALLTHFGGAALAEGPADVPTIDERIKKEAAAAPLSMRFRGTTAEECRKWQEQFSAKLRQLLGNFAPPKKWQTITDAPSISTTIAARNWSSRPTIIRRCPCIC